MNFAKPSASSRPFLRLCSTFSSPFSLFSPTFSSSQSSSAHESFGGRFSIEFSKTLSLLKSLSLSEVQPVHHLLGLHRPRCRSPPPLEYLQGDDHHPQQRHLRPPQQHHHILHQCLNLHLCRAQPGPPTRNYSPTEVQVGDERMDDNCFSSARLSCGFDLQCSFLGSPQDAQGRMLLPVSW